MKKYWVGLLVLMLALCGVGAQAEEMLPETNRILTEANMLYWEADDASSMNLIEPFAFKGDIYAHDHADNIFRYDRATEGWEQVYAPQEYGGNTKLFGGEDFIYHLACGSGKVSTLTPSDNGFVHEKLVDLNWENMLHEETDYVYPRSMQSMVVMDGAMYIGVQNDEWMYDLYKFDLATGEKTRIDTTFESFEGMTVYQGKLLFGVWTGICTLDPVTGEEALLQEVSNPMSLCVWEDSVFYMLGEAVYSNQSGAFQEVAYLPVNDSNVWSSVGIMLDADTFATICEGDVRIVRLGEALPERIIRMSDNLYNIQSALSAYSKQYPDVPLVQGDTMWFDAHDLSQSMTGANAYDVYPVYLSLMDIKLLAQKEYILPLDASLIPEGIYPQFLDAVTYNGQVYALPVWVEGQGYGVSVRALESVGLSAEDIPQTYDEFLDFIEMWQSDYASHYPEMSLMQGMEYTDLKTSLLNQILQAHMLKQQSQGEMISFNSPQLLATLEHLEKTDFFGFRDPDSDSVTGSVLVFGSTNEAPKEIFYNYANITISEHENSDYQFMPLRLSQDDAAYLPVQMEAFVVNADTRYPEEIERMFKCVMDNLPQVAKINMFKGEYAPVENEYITSYYTRAQKMLDYVLEQSALADEAVQQELKEFIDIYRENMESFADRRYSITTEQIAAYQARTDNLYPQQPNFLSNSEELRQVISRFRDGDLTAQNFLRELDRRVQMMQLEN